MKPIASTPTLTGEDAANAIRSALVKPTPKATEKNEKRLLDAKKVFK